MSDRTSTLRRMFTAFRLSKSIVDHRSSTTIATVHCCPSPTRFTTIQTMLSIIETRHATSRRRLPASNGKGLDKRQATMINDKRPTYPTLRYITSHTRRYPPLDPCLDLGTPVCHLTLRPLLSLSTLLLLYAR
jgi:hypothetical protein